VHEFWETITDFPVLGNEEVHLWCATLRPAPATLERMRKHLNEEEAERADKFVFDRDREAYTQARGLLRVLLSRYLGKEPGDIVFATVGNGKPALPDSGDGPALEFNVSHSGDLALYGFTRLSEIGVDIEKRRELKDALQIAESYFSPGERAALRELTPGEQARAFFNCWSRKEAFIKTRGEGLSRPLDSFDVSLRPGEKVALLSADGNSGEGWTLDEPPSPDPDYALAYCLPAVPEKIRGFRWQSGIGLD